MGHQTSDIRYWGAFTYILALALCGSSEVVAQSGPDSVDIQIEHALLAIPEEMRDSAAVLGYSPDGELVTLREGTNEMVCLADKPGDDRYSGACYHESLEPFMARGRELRAEGVEGKDVLARRHEEMDAGTLALPKNGAVLYNMSMKLEAFDPATASPTLYSLYTPYATVESTGLPEKPAAPGGPWIMRSGTPTAHIMIIVPRQSEY